MIVRARRPLWTIGITWAIVCLVGMWLSPLWLCVTIGLSAVCLAVLISIKKTRRRRSWLLIVGTIVVSAAVLLHTELVRYRPVEQAIGTEVSFCAVVESDSTMPYVTVLSGDLPVGTRVCLWSGTTQYTLQRNEILEGRFRLQSYGTTGLRALQTKASGVWCLATPTEPYAMAPVGFRPSSLTSVLAVWRRTVASEMQRLLPRDVGAVISGICLGEDKQLSLAAETNFRVCGISHLFSVSGLHLSILTQAILRLLERMRVSRRARGAIGAVAVIGIVLLMGQTSSVTRAGVMCLLVLLGGCLRRQADAWNSLGLALLLLLAAEPFAVYDVGLLLSFLATFGILFLMPKIEELLLRIPMPEKALFLWKPLCTAVSVTLAALIATLPVMVLYFGEVSLVSVLANPLVTLPATWILILGWIAIPFITIDLEWIYHPLLIAIGWISRGVLWIAETLAALPYRSVAIQGAPMIVWLFGSILLVYSGYRLFRYRGIGIAAVVSIVTFCVNSF